MYCKFPLMVNFLVLKEVLFLFWSIFHLKFYIFTQILSPSATDQKFVCIQIVCKLIFYNCRLIRWLIFFSRLPENVLILNWRYDVLTPKGLKCPPAALQLSSNEPKCVEKTCYVKCKYYKLLINFCFSFLLSFVLTKLFTFYKIMSIYMQRRIMSV